MRLSPSLRGLLISTALTFLPTVTAIYEDEAYKTDFAHQLLGLPQPQHTFFHRPRKNDKASLLYTLSDAGVLGAVNPGTGDIVWRQLLDDPLDTSKIRHESSLRLAEDEIVTVSGSKVSTWDALSGRLRWLNEFEGEGVDVEVISSVDTVIGSDIVALFADIATGAAVTRRLEKDTGAVVWQHESDIGDIPARVFSTSEAVWIVVLQNAGDSYKIAVTCLESNTGAIKQNYAVPSVVESVEDVLFAGAHDATPIVIWTEAGQSSIKSLFLGAKTSQSLDVFVPATGIDGGRSFSVHVSNSLSEQAHLLISTQTQDSHWGDVFSIDTVKESLSHSHHIPLIAGSGAFSPSTIDNKLYFTRNTETEVQILSSTSDVILERWPISGKRVGVSHAVNEVVKTKGDTFAVRSAVVTANGDWVLIRNGAVAWSRPEGLSRAVAATYAEIPVGETLAKELEVEAHSNPVSAYIHRVTRHIADLKHLPMYLASLPQNVMASLLSGEISASSETLTRDTFGFSKLIILATERGMIYALDSAKQGRIIWSTRAYTLPAPQAWDVKAMWAEDHKGQVTIRGSEGEYVVVKTATGAIVEKTSPGSWPALESSAIVDSPSGQWIMPIGVGGNPGSIPEAWAPNSTVVVRSGAQVRGLGFEKQDSQGVPYEVWSFTPGADETIHTITTRPRHDPVASIGHVLADRTVLYKYVNPNLALITAASAEKSSVTLYLLDSSSGVLLYTTTHLDVDITKPITSAISGNTFTYTLFISSTDRFSTQGYHLFTSELFESSLSNDRGSLGPAANYSGMLPQENPVDEPHLPHVKTLSYLIPQPVTLQTTTSTLQGISTTSLILYLPLSNSLITIPRHVLDARRPFGRPPTKAEQEEGLMPYSPIIDFDPKSIISHKREVMGIKGILTTPALIESTSLVIAYGLDVFGTRVTPSGAFDVLGSDFSRVSLLGTVGLLGLLTALMAPLVRGKMVRGRWIST